ncbi:hypothetical protein IQ03_00058 [Gemmobacter caeni]|uniref:Uncharacterized protein n=2 Tax=Gemmobacter TaxID=204456 RepID=A0A2T6BAU5_9RHOB|nr:MULTISPECIES: DUF6477 family protein [Gemmobacter]PTX53148.1 hypothetical protein C8N34_10160 [Gemmobacter caeni]TWJ05259.1 hypothetical protein IQ03_00058 [Gemmobacter caeni]GHC17137.1 hypothetical protein GCM10007291_14700 [Gemmobacter nanjingensis]
MTDFRALLADLRRPRLLIRAARYGMTDYRRDRDLKRLLRQDKPLGPEKTLPRLIDEEERLESIRRAGDASYSLNQHIEVLIALMSELHLLPRPQQSI